jgi:hypothetical protein
MPEQPDALVLELEDLSRHLEPADANIDVVANAIARIEHSKMRGRRRHLVAALAVAAAVIATLIVSVPATRHAVADLLGLGGERITETNVLPANLGTRLDLGRRVAVRDATQRAPGAVSFPSQIGRPDAAFAGRPPTGVSFLWRPSPQLPPTPHSSELGLLLTVFRGDLDRALIEKAVPPGTTMAPVEIDGEAGYWLGGDAHAFMYLDSNGHAQRDTARLAANTLVWTHDGVTYRLESSLERDAAVTLARTIGT